MPNYVDYSTENMNGTPVHTFMDPSGQPSPPMFGPEADGLAQNIEQFKAFRQANGGPDMRVAGPGGGEPNMSEDPGMSINPGAAGPAQPSPAPGAPPAPGNSPPPGPMGPPAPPGLVEQDNANQAAAGIRSAASKGSLVAGALDPAAFINAPVTSRGVSKADLQKRARDAVAIPKGEEETVEGAAPYDQDAADARADANIDRRLVEQQKADLIAHRAEQAAHAFDQQAAIASLRLQREAQKQQAVEDGVQQDAAHARDFRDQVAKQQVDPNRLFSGDRGALNTVLAVIGQGLGAFASAGGGSPSFHGKRTNVGTPNFASQIINSAIDRDIRAQEVNIRTNQENSANQLNDIYHRLGDMNQAKTVLKQMQTDYAGLQMKAAAARDGSQDAQLAHQEWEANNAADRAEQERKFLADSYGKHTVKVAQTFASPQAGGSRAPTWQEQYQRAEAVHKTGQWGTEDQQAQANVGKTLADTNAANATAAKAGDPANNPAQAAYNKEIQFVDSAQGALAQVVEKSGGTLDPNTGKITWGNKDIPGVGAWDSVRNFFVTDPKAAGLDRSVSLGAAAIEKGIEGDAAGEAGIKQIKEDLGSGNEDTRRAGAEALARVLAGRRQSVDAGASDQVRANRGGNAKSSAIERMRLEQQGGAGPAKPAIQER